MLPQSPLWRCTQLGPPKVWHPMNSFYFHWTRNMKYRLGQHALCIHAFLHRIGTCEFVSKSFRTESVTKSTITTINTHWEATQRVSAAKLTKLTHKIAIQLHLVAESYTICSSRCRRPVRKLLDTPSYIFDRNVVNFAAHEFKRSNRYYITYTNTLRTNREVNISNKW
jgi:hypothetical protein